MTKSQSMSKKMARTVRRRTNPAFNRKVRGALDHARSPPTVPSKQLFNNNPDAGVGADHDKGETDMTTNLMAAWHARREAELDAEEDRRLKPAPLSANATPAQRTIHQNQTTYYKAKLDQRADRDRVRAELAATQAPFRAARDAEAQARADAERTAQEEAQLARAEAHEQHLRRRYLSQPGATMASWEAEKAEVLKADRLQAVQTLTTEQDINRARVARNYE